MEITAKWVVGSFVAMSVLLLAGGVPAGDQNTQKADPRKTTCRIVEERGTIAALGFNMWEAQLHIAVSGKPEEFIKAEWAVLKLEGDRAILTLKDRDLQFRLPGYGDQKATEEASIARIEFSGGQKLTLNFHNGKKEQLPRAFIQVMPKLDVIVVREFRGSDTPIWEKFYGSRNARRHHQTQLSPGSPRSDDTSGPDDGPGRPDRDGGRDWPGRD